MARSLRIAVGLLPLLGLALTSEAALAGSESVEVVLAAAPGNSLALEDERFGELFRSWQALETSGPAHASAVTISIAGDAPGRPVYFSRSTVGGTGSLITFSNRPFRASRTYARLPSRGPVGSARLTSGFGMRRHPILGRARLHSGIDLAAPAGTPVAATSAGTVSFADWNGGYGLLVAVDHGNGLQTRYAHLSRLNVSPGQPVRKGDILGLVGSTGRSTGPHLHYETRVNGIAVNPLSR